MSSTSENAKSASTRENVESTASAAKVASQVSIAATPIVTKGLIEKIEQEQKKNKKTT